MTARYDDDIWALVPPDRPPPAPALLDFVRSLGGTRRALDLGCGDGRLGEHLAAEELVVADVSALALARAGERLPEAELLQLQPDAPLPLEDASFDLVLCAETIEHVRDVQLLLSEVRRVLRPRGTLAITTPAHGRTTGLGILVRGFGELFDPLSPHLRFFSRSSLRRLLDELGFDVRSLRTRSRTLMAVATR